MPTKNNLIVHGLAAEILKLIETESEDTCEQALELVKKYLKLKKESKREVDKI